MLFGFCVSHLSSGQNTKYSIEGHVLNKQSRESIPYANIVNKNSRKGTIINIDGYFRINNIGNNDTLIISFIGFKLYTLICNPKFSSYYVYLEENINQIHGVNIIAPDYSYLYQILVDCKKNAPKKKKEVKSYFELKSFIQSKQVEMIEGYYNSELEGYDITALNIKTGRLGIQPYNKTFFTSQGSSRAISMLKLFEGNYFFPKNPLEFSAKKCKKLFYLYPNKTFKNENSDSVLIIDYKPKLNNGEYFNGQIWIDKNTKHILKITMQCNNCKLHPFLPLFSIDSISKVDFNITKTYKEVNGQLYFDHMDFIYNIGYISRVGNKYEYHYTIATAALLYAYDYEHLFVLPNFSFSMDNISDYHKLNAMPYNDFFWNNNDEYRLHDMTYANEMFFNDSATTNNKVLFDSSEYTNRGLLEHPFVKWSNKRLFVRPFTMTTSEDISRPTYKSKQYHLSVKIFMDVNSYNDSTHVLTATILDPYESFYYLPIDSATQCFINMYFDLYEIERMKLQKELEGIKNKNEVVQKIYSEMLIKLKDTKQKYLNEVELGTDEHNMRKWNKYIIDNLGIDNLAIFHPFEDRK